MLIDSQKYKSCICKFKLLIFYMTSHRDVNPRCWACAADL